MKTLNYRLLAGREGLRGLHRSEGSQLNAGWRGREMAVIALLVLAIAVPSLGATPPSAAFRDLSHHAHSAVDTSGTDPLASAPGRGAPGSANNDDNDFMTIGAGTNTFTVDTQADTSDANPGDGLCADSNGDCSLRAAIQEANQNAPGSQILVPPGTYQVASTLVVANSMQIIGAGRDDTIVQRIGAGSVFGHTIGSLQMQGLTITGGSNPQGGGIRQVATTQLTLSDCRVHGNSASNVGGGLNLTNAEVRRCQIDNNQVSPGWGGGIFVQVGGQVLIEDSVVHANTASVAGAGISSDPNAQVTIRGSTIFGNSAPDAAGLDSYQNSIFTVVNSTVVANSGDGVTNTFFSNPTDAGTVILESSTVAHNTGVGVEAGKVTLRNSIVYGNVEMECFNTGNFTVDHSNLFRSGGGCPSGLSDQIVDFPTSAILADALADNGGWTPTLALAEASPAVDAANAGTCPKTDQRGISRPQGAGCDVGAYEVQLHELTVIVSGAGSASANVPPEPVQGGIVSCTEAGGVECSAIYVSGAQIELQLDADAGQAVDGVESSCGGALLGSLFTLDSLLTDCTVNVTFSPSHRTVTPKAGSNGSLDPDLPQQVERGQTVTFTVTPDPGYRVELPITGTCPSGTWNAHEYTTGAIFDDCTVIASFEFAFALTAVGGSGQSAATGANFAEPLLVRVTDPDGVALAGIDLDFHAPESGASANLSSVSTSTNAFGLAWVLASANVHPGSYSVTASLADFPGLAIATFALENTAASFGLLADIDNGRDYSRYGQVVNYLVRTQNPGPDPAHNLDLTVLLSESLDEVHATWICLGPATSGCTPQGNGPLAQTGLGLGVGETLTYLLSVPVRLRPDDDWSEASLHVVAGSADDLSVDSDSLVLLRDGFDIPYGGGLLQANHDGVAPSMLRAEEPVELSDDATSQDGLRMIWHGTSIGDTEVAVDRLRMGGQTWLRLRTQNETRTEISTWLRWPHGVSALLWLEPAIDDATPARVRIAVADTGRELELPTTSNAGS